MAGWQGPVKAGLPPAVMRKLAALAIFQASRKPLVAPFLNRGLTSKEVLPDANFTLSAIEVAGDQVNPMRVKPDITKLTDEELDQLEKIVLKVGTGASGGPDGNADQASSSHPSRRRA